jgi:hypothetical protein
MDILAKLFGSAAKVKLMRLFLFNPELAYTLKEITNRAKITSREAKKELALLISFGVVRMKPVRREVRVKRRKKIVLKKIEEKGYTLNQRFAYLTALKSLLTSASVHADDALTKKFAKVGKLKVFIATGVFLQRWDSRVDLLIVGDEISTARLEKAVATLEAEIGKEISYSAFDTEDFEYRLGIHDRLIRDILDFPHTVLVDRLGIEGK